jgi:hypothetical protein
LQKVLFSNSGFWNDMLAVGGLRKVRNFPAGDLVYIISFRRREKRLITEFGHAPCQR